MTNKTKEEEMDAIRELVGEVSRIFEPYNMMAVGQTLSALLGLYFHRLNDDASRLAVGGLIIDGATETCRALQEEDRRRTLN